jgi:phosphohistidine phosphatase
MALELLLLRHGIAEDADPCDPAGPELADARRPLSAAGRRRTMAVLKVLVRLDLRADLLVTSPLLRAHQTAELALAAGLAQQLSRSEALAPGGDALAWVRQGQAAADAPWPDGRVVLVGHEPDLGNLAAALIGAPAGSIVLKKAGVALLACSAGAPSARLLLLASPRMLLQ